MIKKNMTVHEYSAMITFHLLEITPYSNAM
ncbi:MAG: hypothetical protein K0S23_187 [Fluviicola sp.]|jgi:hypothetical protein|nr:hypothetical protein [Fluviicola sp.]